MSSDQILEVGSSSKIVEVGCSSDIVAKATSLANELERVTRLELVIRTQDFVTLMLNTMSTVWEVEKLSTSLSNELRALVAIITQQERQSISRDIFVKAQDILAALKTMEFNAGSIDPPLSKQLMVDPAILTSGMTFEPQNIQACLDTGSQICPLSKNERQQFDDLMLRLEKSGISEQKQAAKKIYEFTLALPQFRAHFAKEERTIFVLLSPLKVLDGDVDAKLQNNIISTVFQIINHVDDNIKVFANNPDAISSVIKALGTGYANTRGTAASILFLLSMYNDNKVVIGDSGGVTALLDFIEGAKYATMMDAIRAFFNLCIIRRNRLKAIEHGAVRVILKKVVSIRLKVNELWAILRMLSMHGNAIKQIIEHDGVCVLLHGLRGSSRNDEAIVECCVTMLDWICSNDSSKLTEIDEEDKKYEKISLAVNSGTMVARKAAKSILTQIDKAI
ncbi:hypothetical protein GIB67_002745 [Kingdonia uniflora]|uniref:RING-type E3 ubiquitin transferase n=1 Tax=Kingdonia uniflora TaxID=39325 RepID=A0A7J7N4K2_9MAGN|nr:hypothetical protein GIB67_002745 [Kingdonia uniflora]